MTEIIEDRVIALKAANAVIMTEGVAGLKGFLSENLSRKLGKYSELEGIKISLDEEKSELIFNINIVVSFDVKIPEVAWNVQNNVKKQIENISDYKVKAVNINVQGVCFNRNGEQS